MFNFSRILLLSACAIAGCSRSVDPVAGVAQARVLLHDGKGGEARILLKNIAEKNPTQVAARVLLARIALDNGDAKAANDELSRIDATRFIDAESQLLRLRVEVASGKAQDVLKALDSGQFKTLKNSDAAIVRAMALRSLGRGADAIEGLRAALAADPTNSELIVQLAQTLAASGNLRQAVQELDSAISARPGDSDLLLLRGELRLRGGLAPKAIEDFKAALAAAPPSWPMVSKVSSELLIAEAQLAAGNLDAVKAQIAKIDKLSPNVLGTRLLSAKLAMAQGHPAEAVDLLQRIAEVLPDNSSVQYMFIEALLRSGNIARATAALQRRVKQDPTDNNARNMLAKLMLRQNRPGDVLELLANVPGSNIGQQNNETDGLLSVARMVKQRAGQEISTLTSQLASAPNDAPLRTRLAAAYLMNGEPNRSLVVLHDAKWSQAPADATGIELAAQLALGNDRDANQLVKVLVDSTAVSIDSLLSAGDSAQRAGNNDIAARLIDRAVQRDAYNEGALSRRANLEFSQQHYAAARTALDLLIAHHPAVSYAQIARARVAEAEGNVDGARAALQAAVRAEPARPDASLMLAGMELRESRIPQATAALDALIAAAPKDGIAANAAGLVLLGAKRFDEARLRFRQAAEQKGDVAEYWFNLGRAQLALTDRAAARDSFAASVERRPDWLDANVAVTRLNMELGDKAAARRFAEAFAARAATNPAAWQLVGEVAVADKRLPDAANAFARAYSAQPSSQAASREFAVRAAMGSAGADQSLVTWLAQHPDDLAVRRELADYYLRTNATAAAGEQLEKVVAAAPNDVAALNNLAWTLTRSDLPRAETLARRAYAIEPQSASIADTLGWILVQAKKFPEARQMLERASKAAPKDASMGYHYAVALARAGDRDAARQALNAALAGDSKFADRGAAEQLAKELTQ